MVTGPRSSTQPQRPHERGQKAFARWFVSAGRYSAAAATATIYACAHRTDTRIFGQCPLENVNG
jgi:hypothetical protein